MALDRLTQITSSGISSTSTITVSAIAGSISGVVTATSLTVTGNVTSGMNVTGVVTATEFVGNVNSAGVSTFTTLKVGTGVTISAGVITATSFVGDGSGLSGITQTTINNNANNRIITGSATANTLEAESDLTYDGTTLAVNAGGNITVGESFIRPTSLGVGTTDTTGRDAGIGTAPGTIIYNTTTNKVNFCKTAAAGAGSWEAVTSA